MKAPESCRAAVLVANRGPMEIVDVRLPEKLEPGAVLVRMLAATVCATDVHLWEGSVGSKKAAARLPVILGHETVGEVIQLTGEPCDSLGNSLQEGDRIIWTHGYCGRCAECVVEQTPALCENRRGYMAMSPAEYPYLNGGFAEYGYVYPTSGRLKVPAILPDEVAAASSCALRTMVNAFDQLGRIEERHTVVIQGTGPLGLFSTAMAATMGPRRIIVIGGPADRLSLARQWSADHTIDVTVTSADERLSQILELTSGRGADIVIEVSGVPAAFTEGVAMLRQGGRYLIVGQIHNKDIPFNPSALVMKQAKLIGSFSGAVNHYARALSFLETHADRFNWADMITSREPLNNINEAFARMRNYQDIKPAIIFD
jgi:L-iditol 2-dehydrogenase